MKKPQTSKHVSLVLLLLLVIPLGVHAQFTFTTNSDGTLTVARYTGPGGAVIIPDTTNGLLITSIGSTVFFNNYTVTTVTVGTNVTSLGNQAFSYSSISSISLPASVTNIAFNSFLGCNYLLAIAVAANNPTFSSAAGVLFNQNQTKLISFPEGKAGSYSVPVTVTNVGIYAFSGSSNLTSVTLSSNVNTIGGYALYNCPGLTTITVDTNNQWYSSEAGVLFNENQDTLIQYPIGNVAASYTVPDTVTNISTDAFYGCPNLTNVTLGEKVAIIGDVAFEYCRALASITFPDSVQVIGGDAFAECAALTNIVIGAGVTNIFSQAFLGCPNVATITVATANPAFSSAGGVLFNKNQSALVLYPAGSSANSYTVPSTVTNILQDAFMDAYHLAAVILDTNLLSIGDSAFQACYDLASISIPNSVTNLGFNTFFDCTSLTNVVIGSGLNTIGFQAFSFCTGLTAVYFTGNAPATNSNVFNFDNVAIAYYLPGTTGWSATFDGLPTALWRPQIVQCAVRTNQFSFYLNWAANQTVIVESSTNLAHPVWTPLQTNQLSSNSWYFTDAQSTNHSPRFYRARWP